MSGADITGQDVQAVSRMRASGVEALLQLDDWQLTRTMLIRRRMSPDAWEERDGERFQLTLWAATVIAESLNGVRPWEGG